MSFCAAYTIQEDPAEPVHFASPEFSLSSQSLTCAILDSSLFARFLAVHTKTRRALGSKRCPLALYMVPTSAIDLHISSTARALNA